jgi:TP901-1 family phage major tail protein
MAEQAGKDMLLYVSDGMSGWTAFAGLRPTRIALNRETVDITNKDSTNHFRELLKAAGVKSCSFAGGGVFLDAAVDETVRADFFADTETEYRVLVPDFGTFDGAFQITNLEFEGDYNTAVNFTIQLESAGDLTFTSV